MVGDEDESFTGRRPADGVDDTAPRRAEGEALRVDQPLHPVMGAGHQVGVLQPVARGVEDVAAAGIDGDVADPDVDAGLAVAGSLLVLVEPRLQTPADQDRRQDDAPPHVRPDKHRVCRGSHPAHVCGRSQIQPSNP